MKKNKKKQNKEKKEKSYEAEVFTCYGQSLPKVGRGDRAYHKIRWWEW